MADKGETVRTIYQKLWFVMIPAKILGLLPWRIINGDKLTREGLFGRIFSIFLVLGLSLNTINNLLLFIKSLLHYDMFHISNPVFVSMLPLAGNLLIVIIEVYREFTDVQTGRQIIESLGKYDRKVKQLGLVRKDNFSFSWIMSLSIFPSFLVLVIRRTGKLTVSVYKSFYDPPSMILNLAYHLARLKFSIIVHLLYQRYKHLNEIVLPKDQWRMRGNMALNRRVVNINDLVYLHSTLTKATKILIKVYSFELFVWVSSPIWELIVALYHANVKLTFGILGFTELPQVIMALWSLCWLCHTTANEANRFAMQILRTDPELIRARDIDEQLDAAIYMNNNKILFRAWNFYDVNFSTLLIIGTLSLSWGSVVFEGKNWRA